MTATEYEHLTDEWAELSTSHAPADDPDVIRVCHDLRCECEVRHLRDEGRLL